MNRKVKLNQDWMGHKDGTILEVDADTFAEIVKAKAGEEYVEAPPAPPAGADDAVRRTIDAALKDMRKDLADTKAAIHVRDRQDDDPFWGYLGEHNKSATSVTPQEIHFAAGKFLGDVWRAGEGGAAASPALRKCMERATNARQKAAGDGMLVNSDEHGGYAIFPAAAAMINRSALENSVIRSRATVMTMGTQMLRIPYVKDDARKSGGYLQVYNGIIVYWEDELSQMSASRPEIARIELKLKKLAALGYVSDEWIKWSPVTMGSWLIPKFGEAIAYVEDYNFINGKGGGQPKGIRASGARIEIAKEGSQDPDTLVIANTTKMVAQLRRLGNEVWLMNQTVFPQLPMLNVEVGTGGAPVFVTNAAVGVPQSLWGIPIVVTEKVPTLGDADDVMLVSARDYIIADDQSGPEIASSIHFKFDYGQVAFRVSKFVDGAPFTASAYTPPTVGSTAPNTLSPVIGLAERA